MEGMLPEPIRLHGFNNLTKSLSFNFYDLAYVDGPVQHDAYLEHLAGKYNTERLIAVLSEVATMIGANILNIARQDYLPQGSSVTMVLGDSALSESALSENTGLLNSDYKERIADDLVMHLDKSHLTVHTYPENHPDNSICTFRTDIEVSTCGRITPLKALNYLIRSLESDIVVLDYRVRGFTRDVKGNKHFMDHAINSIQNFMAPDISQRFYMTDVNLDQELIFHTKMLLKTFKAGSYLFGKGGSGYSSKAFSQIEQHLKKEMTEIYLGRGSGTI